MKVVFEETVDGFGCTAVSERGVSIAQVAWIVMIAVSMGTLAGALSERSLAMASTGSFMLLAMSVVMWRLVFRGEPRTEVRMSLPRLEVQIGTQTRTITLVGAAVSDGGTSVDLDPLVGSCVQIPTAGWPVDDRARLLWLLRSAAKDGGDVVDVPVALGAIARARRSPAD